MKRIVLFFMLLVQMNLLAQVIDDFSGSQLDTKWKGNRDNFIVNTSGQLQSNTTKLSTASSYYLSTASTSAVDCEWHFWVNLKFTVSGANYVDLFLISDKENLTASNINGYYIRIGGTKKQISLYKRNNGSDTEVIEGVNNIVNSTSNNLLRIKVTREVDKSWILEYNTTGTNDNFISGGTFTDTDSPLTSSAFMGIFIQQSTAATPPSNHFFDDIYAGPIIADTTPPTLNGVAVDTDDKKNILLTFSEPILLTEEADFNLVSGEKPIAINLSADKQTAILTFETEFLSGTIYTLFLDNIIDLAGNYLNTWIDGYQFGIVEAPDLDSLIINEVMFKKPTNAEEYIEIYNRSSKILDLTNIGVAKRGNDGKLGSLYTVPLGTTILPNTYLALSRASNLNAERVYFACPDEANLITLSFPSSFLTDTGATIVLCKDSAHIYDELSYFEKWHNSLIKDNRGVALERKNPNLPTQDANTWHSAASTVNYGTPGYENSQYVEIEGISPKKEFWIKNESFTPNNDGFEDELLIYYDLQENNWISNITIFDASGQKVRKLHQNQLLATKGVIFWDGADNNNHNVTIGIYVIFIELNNNISGKTKNFKLATVVSGTR